MTTNKYLKFVQWNTIISDYYDDMENADENLVKKIKEWKLVLPDDEPFEFNNTIYCQNEFDLYQNEFEEYKFIQDIMDWKIIIPSYENLSEIISINWVDIIHKIDTSNVINTKENDDLYLDKIKADEKLIRDIESSNLIIPNDDSYIKEYEIVTPIDNDEKTFKDFNPKAINVLSKEIVKNNEVLVKERTVMWDSTNNILLLKTTKDYSKEISILANLEITNDNISTLESLVNKVIFAKGCKDQKKYVINRIVLNHLNDIGYFAKSLSWNAKYYCINKWIVLNLKSDKIKYFLNKITWMTSIGTYFSDVMSSLDSYSHNEWEIINVKTFSFYDKKSNYLYFDMNNWKILKITKEKIQKVHNWTDWVIFSSWFDPWEFNENPNLDKNYIKEFISSINFSESENTKEEKEFLLYNILISYFFPELQSSRPILTFIWEPTSWKSTFFNIILLILLWPSFKVNSIPGKRADLESMLVNLRLLFLDNVDTKIDDFLDLIASTSTWSQMAKRKLFTEFGMESWEANTFLWFTTNSSWCFLRQDLLERMIIIWTDKIKVIKSEWEIINNFLQNRNDILSTLVYELQWILFKLEDYKYYNTSFRWDFSNFVININKESEIEIKNIFDKLCITQQRYSLMNDLFVDFLIDIINNTDTDFVAWEFYSSESLHELFVKHSKKRAWIIHYKYQTAKWMARVLTTKMVIYSNTHWIKIDSKIEWANKKLYSISLLDK